MGGRAKNPLEEEDEYTPLTSPTKVAPRSGWPLLVSKVMTGFNVILPEHPKQITSQQPLESQILFKYEITGYYPLHTAYTQANSSDHRSRPFLFRLTARTYMSRLSTRIAVRAPKTALKIAFKMSSQMAIHQTLFPMQQPLVELHEVPWSIR